MPHMNVLDLFVFPNMSKQHCILAWECGGIHVLKENEIWTAVNDVCYQLPSYEGLYRPIGPQKVIKAEGGNEFLGNKSFDKGIHCDICKDFNETIKGLAQHVKE
jgi:hypothetical protein